LGNAMSNDKSGPIMDEMPAERSASPPESPVQEEGTLDPRAVAAERVWGLSQTLRGEQTLKNKFEDAARKAAEEHLQAMRGDAPKQEVAGQEARLQSLYDPVRAEAEAQEIAALRLMKAERRAAYERDCATVAEKARRVLHRGTWVGEAYDYSGMVPDFLEAKSHVQRYEILERERRRRSEMKGPYEGADDIPIKAQTEELLRNMLAPPPMWAPSHAAMAFYAPPLPGDFDPRLQTRPGELDRVEFDARYALCGYDQAIKAQTPPQQTESEDVPQLYRGLPATSPLYQGPGMSEIERVEAALNELNRTRAN